MRDRLLMEDVYERMGFDVKTWVNWSITTPFMTGFRQMLFSKIVPNLKRLGLLTPYVREQPKVGRNDPCPCGSGKKYKQCHGRLS